MTRRQIQHPMQPVVWDKNRVARFKKNEIVRFLLDAGKYDMNDLARMNFSREDRSQFAQLIGYSVSGFGELSYANRNHVSEADAQVAALKTASTDPHRGRSDPSADDND